MPSLIQDLCSSTPEMLDIFGDRYTIDAACRFELALARAQAAEQVISEAEVASIEEWCKDPQLDVGEIARGAAHAGTLTIALVAQLRAHIASEDPLAAAKLHFGATSQDVADTVLMLQVKEASQLIERGLLRLANALAQMARAHVATPMIGRTLLQRALPVSFGLKAASWLLSVDSALIRFRRECETGLWLQLGGAVGTLSGFNGKGFSVADRVAKNLGLPCPTMPWHSRRDGIAGIGTSLAIVIGAAGKIARDIALMAQGEVGEAHEPPVKGRGGSSSMPHKRNPTSCQVALSAAARAPGLASTLLATLTQEHERGLGGWQVENVVLSELFCIASGAIAALVPVAEGLELNTEAMARNLDCAGVGRDTGEASAMVQRALDFHREVLRCRS